MAKSKIEKQLELIKFLHKPHTEKECEEYLQCSDRTIRNLFEDTITFLDTELPMYNRLVEKDGRHLSDSTLGENDSSVIAGTDYKYRSTVHPVFLALNMSEVYMLTYHLLDLVEASSREELPLYKDLVEKIYSQLSEPTQLRISRTGRERYNLEKRDLVKYTSEAEMFDRFNNKVLVYFLKTGEKVRFILNDGTSIEGKIDYRGEYYLITDNNERIRVSELKDKTEMYEKVL